MHKSLRKNINKISQQLPPLGNQLFAGLGGSKGHFSMEASVSSKCADSTSLVTGWCQRAHALEATSLVDNLSTCSHWHLYSHVRNDILSDWRFHQGSQKLEQIQGSVPCIVIVLTSIADAEGESRQVKP